MLDRVGQQLGNYRLIRLLGRGGYAEVYLGEHIYLEMQAAIKVLHARLVDSVEVERFRDEARTIARLVHPHIVRVFDFDVQDDVPFLVMEYAPNGTLRTRHPKGEQLSLEVILPYVRQVAEALQYAHDQHLVHRDIKPENMLLGRDNEVLLSDFGTALVAQTTGYQNMQQGEVIGTIAYMAPELFQGVARPASDQYALGIVVYEWLAGETPFHGSATEIAIQHAMTPPPSLREKNPAVTPEVEQVIMRALAKDYHRRFPRVQDFADALEKASQASPSIYSEPTVVTAAVPPADIPGHGAEAHLLHPQSEPVVSPAPAPLSAPASGLKPAPMMMDTATTEAAHPPASPAHEANIVLPPPPQPQPAPPRPSPQPAYTPAPAPAFPRQGPEQFPRQPFAPRRRNPAMIMLLLLVLLLLLAGAWFAITHVPGLFSNQQATPTGTYPDVAGTYNGIIDNTTAGITTSMSLSIQQNHGQISGQFTVGPALVGSGPFTGSVSTANHIQFTVQGYHGNAPLFFSGTVQSNGSLSGDYCSLGQNGQCSQQAGASGTWQVSRGQAIQPAVAATSTVPQAPTATPTPKHRKHKH